MMFRTQQKIRESVDYTKLRDGSWQAEFRGFATVMATEKNLDACRFKILSEIDAKLADFVVTPPVEQRSAPNRRRR